MRLTICLLIVFVTLTIVVSSMMLMWMFTSVRRFEENITRVVTPIPEVVGVVQQGFKIIHLTFFLLIVALVLSVLYFTVEVLVYRRR